MPHQVSPETIPIRMAKNTSSAAGGQGLDGLTLLQSVFAAETSQASLDASYVIADFIVGQLGYQALEDHDILKEIKEAAADKKSGTRRESAMILLGALFERLPPKLSATEVIFLQPGGPITLALDALSDKGGVVRESAQYALDALFANLSSEALVVGLLPALLQYLERQSSKWQGTVAALRLLGKMAEKARMGMESKEVEKDKEVLGQAMGKRLARLIPVVESRMHHLKAEVRKP